MRDTSFVLLFLFISIFSSCSGFIPLWYPYDYCGAPLEVNPTKTNSTLVLVQVITRHGDRTTLTILPNDNRPFFCNITTFMSPSLDLNGFESPTRLYRKNYLSGEIPGGCLFGQLTYKGYSQHLKLGENLRNLYINNKFLPATFDENKVGIRSTDIPRTLQSAQANMLGLYPAFKPVGNQVPVFDIFTIDQSVEYLYPNDVLCPRGAKLAGQIMNSEPMLAFQKSKQPLLQSIAKALNVSVNSLPGWTKMFDAFHVMDCYDIPYPTGITQDMVNEVWDAANWVYNYQLNNTELVKLWIGMFLGEVVSNLQQSVENQLSKPDFPLYLLYSGHDTTLAPLLTALGIYDGNWPPYASHIEIELYSHANKYYVQVKYQGTALLMPGCDAIMCDIDQFKKAVEDKIINNPETDCE